MRNILNIVIIISSILLIASILLQTRGSGLGGAFGNIGSAYRVRRGFEKLLVITSIVAAISFFGAAFLLILLK